MTLLVLQYYTLLTMGVSHYSLLWEKWEGVAQFISPIFMKITSIIQFKSYLDNMIDIFPVIDISLLFHPSDTGNASCISTLFCSFDLRRVLLCSCFYMTEMAPLLQLITAVRFRKSMAHVNLIRHWMLLICVLFQVSSIWCELCILAVILVISVIQ